MTRSRYKIFETEYPYFMTCTIVGWLPAFTRPDAAATIFDSWRFLQKNRSFQLFGYVILENHLHLIARAPQLSKVMQNFKSLTARRIIDQFREGHEQLLLRQIQAHTLRHKSESEHQLWQEGSQPKQIQNDEMLWQKLEYIHMNPVKRGYVDDPTHWRYSSARNYAGLGGLIEVVRDWV